MKVYFDTQHHYDEIGVSTRKFWTPNVYQNSEVREVITRVLQNGKKLKIL